MLNLFLKKVFKISLIFTIPFILISIYNIFNIYKSKIQISTEKKILVLGDSHTMTSINPKYFEACVNYSLPAEPIYLTYFKLKKIVRDNALLDKIIVGLGYHNFSEYNDKKFTKPQIANFLLNKTYAGISMSNIKQIELNIKIYLKVLLKNIVIMPQTNHFDSFGYYSENEGVNVAKNCIEVIQRHYYNNDSAVAGISQLSKDYLDSIIDFTSRNQLKLYLLNTPLKKEYRTRVPQIFVENYNNCLNIYGIKHTTLDYSSFFASDSLFLDCDHLNTKGAKIFTKHLKSIINDY